MRHPSTGGSINENYSNKLRVLNITAEKWCPWSNKCMTSVLAIRVLLNKKNVESKAYLSVKNTDQFKAHASIESSSVNIVSNLNDYHIIYIF